VSKSTKNAAEEIRSKVPQLRALFNGPHCSRANGVSRHPLVSVSNSISVVMGPNHGAPTVVSVIQRPDSAAGESYV
jgi:transcription elongation factor Elf1